MGGAERLAARHSSGILNARERLDYLLDSGTFVESGLFATSYRAEVRDKTPADAKVTGYGTIQGRPVAIVSNDFTVLGASSSVVNGKKITYVKRDAIEWGMPLVLLGESAGARMPDRMGSAGRAMLGQDPPRIPASAADTLGHGAARELLRLLHLVCVPLRFVVMRKGATMAVARSRVTALAIKQPVDAEDLGGWELHTATTGLVDIAVDTDEEALDVVKRFLSYLPSHSGEAPPVATSSRGLR